MAHSVSGNRGSKKGIYSFVTTIFFIMVLLFVVFGITFLAVKLGQIQIKIDDQTFIYNNVQASKDRIINCYNHSFFDYTLNSSCNITSDIIKGYRIRMLKFRNCTDEEKVWEHGDLKHFKKNYWYLIRIKSNETGFSCPGQLEVYY